MIRTMSVVVVALVASMVACNGPDDTRIIELEPGEECPSGGLRVIDEDGIRDICFPPPVVGEGEGEVGEGEGEGASEGEGEGEGEGAEGEGEGEGESQWTCDERYYDRDDGCDCGCGIVDPDCASALATACQYFYCGDDNAVDPNDNSQCTTIMGSGLQFSPSQLERAARPVARRFAADDCAVVSGVVPNAGDHIGIDVGDVALRNTGMVDITFPMTATTCDGRPKMPRALSWSLANEAGAVVASGDNDLVCATSGPTCADPLAAGQRAYAPEDAGFRTSALFESAFMAVPSDLPAGTYQLSIVIDPDQQLQDSDRSDNTTVTTVEFAPTDNGYLPDLVVNEELLASTIAISTYNEQALDSCLLQEGCLLGPGNRTLLEFSTSTPNFGGADFLVGDPTQTRDTEYAPCHDHYHYYDYALYRLYEEGTNNVVLEGRKQAFAVIDIEEALENVPDRRYGDGYQGITRGWTDIYNRGLPCQWVDITGVPGGAYDLEVVVNPTNRIPEQNYTNNSVRTRIVVPVDPNVCVPADELCGNQLDDDCDGDVDDADVCPPVDGAGSCATAAALPMDGVVRANLEDVSALFASSCAAAEGGSAFFSLTVPNDRLALLSTAGTPFDTVLSVFATDSCKQQLPVEVLCNDDSCGAATSQGTVSLPSGAYTVVVRAKQLADTGVVTLTVDTAGCTPTTLIAVEGPIEQALTGAYAADRGGTTCGAGNGRDADVALALCAGTTTVTVDGCNASDAAMVAVRRGDCQTASAELCDFCLADTTTLEGPGLAFITIEALSPGDTSYNVQMRATPVDTP